MRITFSLADADGETEVVVLCEDIPKRVRLEVNEMGCLSSLRKLAALLERCTDLKNAISSSSPDFSA
jgi:hypothetical protein